MLDAVLGLGPQLKVDATTSRSIPVTETDRRLRELLPRIPVTRVSDLRPLDELGLAVFAAVTPLARDLTTHLGKGADAVSARVSALMEAIERTSAESVAPERQRLSTYERLLREADPMPISPLDFDLPPDTWFAPDRPCRWVRGHDILRGEHVYTPLDLVISPPEDGVLHDVDTNGLAAGNTLLEAVIHGLCEVIERDAVSQQEFFELYGDADEVRPPEVAIDPSTLAEPERELVERIGSHGLELRLHDLTCDIQVPTLRALLLDTHFPAADEVSSIAFAGFGTHPHAGVAVRRAISEAVQSRLGLIHAARDTIHLIQPRGRVSAHKAMMRRLHDGVQRPFESVASRSIPDLREELEWLLDRVRAAGFERVVATDLTHPDLQIPVVRVRVPGAACFMVNRRRVGWRCQRHLL